MRTKFLFILYFLALFIIHSDESRNYSFGFGISLSNFTFEDLEDIPPFKTKVSITDDLRKHAELNVGYSFDRFSDNSPFSIRSDISVILARFYADASLSIAYDIGNSQFYAGPLIAYDGYFYPFRAIFEMFDEIILDGDDVQEYWYYLGVNLGYRLNFTDKWGLNLRYRQSLWNMTTLVHEEYSHYLNRFNFITLGLFRVF